MIATHNPHTPAVAERWLHVSAAARRRYALPSASFGMRGQLLVGGWSDAQALAHAINTVRAAGPHLGTAVRAGELYAAAVLHELMHALLASAAGPAGAAVLAAAPSSVRAALGEEGFGRFLRAFAETFPPPATRGAPDAEAVLEEAYLLHLANANPALARLAELFDDAPLRRAGAYPRVLEQVEEALRRAGGSGRGGGQAAFGTEDRAARPSAGAEGGAEAQAAPEPDDLVTLLWAPQRSSPTSLEGQLRVVRERWAGRLGGRYAALTSALVGALDLLEEERHAAGGGHGGRGPAAVPDAAVLAGGGAVEAFSRDSDWMPRVVMVAKSTYVWLHQLARRFGREVRRLDQVPDEALAELAGFGFNALWLIGVWQRSEASRAIKHRRGQLDAAASAYALDDYVIARDLGGEAAFADLRDRAARHGLRLASDMVPNHVGLDGRWVAEHPDWFVQLDHAPFPGYTFEGPDLSGDPRVAVRIEDRYWDNSDAAVVFQRVDAATGEVRFLYHGNDGTGMPWNDTAQLDYLRADVREAVIQTILHVARQFPIIRFDAAMTLAKEHIRRLWYPAPGEGGAIPSRSRYGAMPADEFERRMPHEFWREVVDRVAAEAPGTLLLAEAFWMMEGYFVRTLGMHRVYNSAFMNMLRDGDNAAYRALLRNVLAFDPRVLERFVNFMNNPDEESAIEQFGDGDRYLGVTVLLATMPGLPLFGHGQVEGYREKYGMEYRAARHDEVPEPRLVERHRRHIAPLLRRRGAFAGAAGFRLFDLVGADGAVIEDVFAFTNRGDGAATLVLVNNRFERAEGRLLVSAPFVDVEGGATRTERLGAVLGLPAGAGRFAVLRDALSGRSWLGAADALHRDGLPVRLEGYEARVFLDVDAVEDEDGSYAALASRLGGEGVEDLEGARSGAWFEDARRHFAALLRAAAAGDREAAAAAAQAFVAAAQARGVALRPAAPRPEGTTADAQGSATAAAVPDQPPAAAAVPDQPPAAAAVPDQPPAAAASAALLAGLGIDGTDLAARALADVDRLSADAGLVWGLRAALALAALEEPARLHRRLRLGTAPAGALRGEGLADEGVADEGVVRDLPRVLGELLPVGAPGRPEAVLERLVASAAAREFLAVHDHDGVRWFDRERYRALRDALVALALARFGGALAPDGTTPFAAALRRLLDVAEVRAEYRFARLAEGARRAAAGAAGAAPVDPESLM